MKILFITRSSLFTNSGGDTVQVLNTATYLRRLGLEIDIRLCNESIDYSQYDLLHFFNITRPSDILYHIRKSAKPYVLSTIYVNYSGFDKKRRSGPAGLVLRLLPKNLGEYAKLIARAINNGERIISPEYLWIGQRNAIRKIIGGASMLLPNSFNEYRRLVSDFGIEQTYRVIPNAVDAEVFHDSDGSVDKDGNLVLCVGRIEGLKNQLSLISALNNTKYQLVFIGNAALNQQAYYKKCRKEAAGNIRFIEKLPQEEIVNYYRQAKVHVLPSWFETTGLSSLEAAAMGCNVVITDKGDTREYFGEMAFYCDPDSPGSIRQAVELAARVEKSSRLQEMVQKQYTWSVAAEKTLAAYRFILLNK